MTEKPELWMEYFLSQINEIIVTGWKGIGAKFQDLLERKPENKKVAITTVNRGDNTCKRRIFQSGFQAILSADQTDHYHLDE